MAKVCTLQDTKSMESKKIQGQGYRLGSAREQELEEALRDSIKSNSEITSEYKNMQVVYSNHSKNTNKENDQLRHNNEKLSKHVYQLIDEVKRLRSKIDTLKSRITDKDLSLAESKAENVTESKKIKSLESIIKILESKLSSTQKDVISIQNDSLKKDSEILSLKSKIAELENIKSELESKVNELECLKSETISKPIVGGDDEKIITKSDDTSAVSEPIKNLSQYFIRKKSMDQVRKIDGNILDHIDDENTKLPKVDTENSCEIVASDNINISDKTNNNILQEMSNVSPHLAQRENNMSSLIESNTQMGPGPGRGAIPIVAYMLLALLIIAVMWFVVLRRTWGFEKKSDRLRDMWA
ncbi:3630_t:CDS:1, partial [Entrophospora sp. SA101]